ncbi:hypothetical protein [Paenibacillus sp. Soil766]|uniref:hypothetical protein n=1 Tax=Paenibacillus sp. Soil766 TaxID=1736404 RepID=UPI0007C7EA1F|nr:hypothetical protein [Paenibacillus sp. Soil766]
MRWMSLILICSILLTACGTKDAKQEVHSFSEATIKSSPNSSTTAEPAIQSPSPEVKPTIEKEIPAVTGTPSAVPSTAPSAVPSVAPTPSSDPKKSTVNAVMSTPSPKIELPKQTVLVEEKPIDKVIKTKQDELKWSEFFDNDKQTTPSNKFWDLSGKQVVIKGYMGEVLSMEKNWFLLIPEPGAECPFDNGDETYWNKIMIVYLPKGDKLRFTSGPLQITGRLDVGIKIDDSGYKTMFRLYDAKFEKIKE